MHTPKLEKNVTYIICPEKSCTLFWEATGPCPCDGSCPYQEKQKLLIICGGCNEIILLPVDPHYFKESTTDARTAASVAPSPQLAIFISCIKYLNIKTTE